jgi:hypothetical protein
MITASTARYIGFRTHRYGPVITSSSVGAMGAGVPRPSQANLTKAFTSSAAPATMIKTPMRASGADAGQGGPNSHPVSSHGTKPATTQGAAMKKTALPMAAVDLCFKRYFPFRRAFADSRLFAFCNALTSSSLLIFERPAISSLVACS